MPVVLHVDQTLDAHNPSRGLFKSITGAIKAIENIGRGEVISGSQIIVHSGTYFENTLKMTYLTGCILHGTKTPTYNFDANSDPYQPTSIDGRLDLPVSIICTASVSVNDMGVTGLIHTGDSCSFRNLILSTSLKRMNANPSPSSRGRITGINCYSASHGHGSTLRQKAVHVDSCQFYGFYEAIWRSNRSSSFRRMEINSNDYGLFTYGKAIITDTIVSNIGTPSLSVLSTRGAITSRYSGSVIANVTVYNAHGFNNNILEAGSQTYGGGRIINSIVHTSNALTAAFRAQGTDGTRYLNNVAFQSSGTHSGSFYHARFREDSAIRGVPDAVPRTRNIVIDPGFRDPAGTTTGRSDFRLTDDSPVRNQGNSLYRLYTGGRVQTRNNSYGGEIRRRVARTQKNGNSDIVSPGAVEVRTREAPSTCKVPEIGTKGNGHLIQSQICLSQQYRRNVDQVPLILGVRGVPTLRSGEVQENKRPSSVKNNREPYKVTKS